MPEVARPGGAEFEIEGDHVRATAEATLHTGERLQKVLARTGVGSRRVCEDLIVDGRVTVNGDVPVLGRRVDIELDVIELDGVPLPVRPGLVHYLVNKPPGVVSTVEDTHGRPTVVGLVPPEPHVYPVGRLDMDSEGLLIVTNDGELTHRLTHPSYGVPKEYLLSSAPIPRSSIGSPCASPAFTWSTTRAASRPPGSWPRSAAAMSKSPPNPPSEKR